MFSFGLVVKLQSYLDYIIDQIYIYMIENTGRNRNTKIIYKNKYIIYFRMIKTQLGN